MTMNPVEKRASNLRVNCCLQEFFSSDRNVSASRVNDAAGLCFLLYLGFGRVGDAVLEGRSGCSCWERVAA